MAVDSVVESVLKNLTWSEVRVELGMWKRRLLRIAGRRPKGFGTVGAVIEKGRTTSMAANPAADLLK